MFPSSGYFSHINCPFLVGGSCDRPYCNFKHHRMENKEAALVHEIIKINQILDEKRRKVAVGIKPSCSESEQEFSDSSLSKEPDDATEEDFQNNDHVKGISELLEENSSFFELLEKHKKGPESVLHGDNTTAEKLSNLEVGITDRGIDTKKVEEDTHQALVLVPEQKLDNFIKSTALNGELEEVPAEETKVPEITIVEDIEEAPQEPKVELKENDETKNDQIKVWATSSFIFEALTKMSQENRENLMEIVEVFLQMPSLIAKECKYLKSKLKNTETGRPESESKENLRSKDKKSNTHSQKRKSEKTKEDSEKSENVTKNLSSSSHKKHSRHRHSTNSSTSEKDKSSSRPEKDKPATSKGQKRDFPKSVSPEITIFEKIAEKRRKTIDLDEICSPPQLSDDDSVSEMPNLPDNSIPEAQHIPAASSRVNKLLTTHSSHSSSPFRRQAMKDSTVTGSPVPARRNSLTHSMSTSRPAATVATNGIKRVIIPPSNVAALVRRPTFIPAAVGASISKKPDTSVAKGHDIRQLIQTGKIPSISTGTSAVPCGKRQTYLRHLIDFVKANTICLTFDEAINRAVEMESAAFKAYPDNAVRYKMAIVGAKKTLACAQSKRENKEITESGLYDLVFPLMVPVEKLISNGFLHVNDDMEVVFTPNLKYKFNSKWKHIQAARNKGLRYCTRCAAEYEVDDRGKQIIPNCSFHSQRKQKIHTRVRKGDTFYPCCHSESPCTTEPYHVTENLDPIQGSYCAPPNPDGPKRVVALDCEMVATFDGIELAHIVVIDMKSNVIYQSLVKPANPIASYLTTFSGLTPEIMEKATKNLQTVQKELGKIIKEDTIIIGHSLDSDFRAMKLIHTHVVDTSILFQEESSPLDEFEYKVSLKKLARDQLSRVIQENELGHDPLEDAKAAFDVVKKHVGAEI